MPKMCIVCKFKHAKKNSEFCSLACEDNYETELMYGGGLGVE